MTFLELQDLTLSWLDDKNAGYFTRPDVKRWLNLGQRETQKIVIQAFEGHYRVTKQTTLVLYQREYQLPSDFKKLSRLEIILDGAAPQSEAIIRLGKITENQQDLAGPRTGTPNCYYFRGDQLVLVPLPDSAKTLRMTYIYRVADMVNDGDTPDIPEDYHEYLAILASITGLSRDGGQGDKLSAMIKRQADFIEQFKRDAEERNIDEPRTVVQTVDDDFDTFY